MLPSPRCSHLLSLFRLVFCRTFAAFAIPSPLRRPPASFPLENPRSSLTVPARSVILILYKIHREKPLFFGPVARKLQNLGGKTESGSVEGCRESPRLSVRSRRGMQKLSGKRIGSGRHFGKCGFTCTPKGQPLALGERESLRSGRRQKDQGGQSVSFCMPFLSSSSPPQLPRLQKI